jgi:hypothetical protein
MTLKRSIGSIAAAFSAALMATTAANAMSGNASQPAERTASKQVRPSPAALLQIDQIIPRAVVNMRPTWEEVWPQSTFVEVQG